MGPDAARRHAQAGRASYRSSIAEAVPLRPLYAQRSQSTGGSDSGHPNRSPAIFSWPESCRSRRACPASPCHRLSWECATATGVLFTVADIRRTCAPSALQNDKQSGSGSKQTCGCSYCQSTRPAHSAFIPGRSHVSHKLVVDEITRFDIRIEGGWEQQREPLGFMFLRAIQ